MTSGAFVVICNINYHIIVPVIPTNYFNIRIGLPINKPSFFFVSVGKYLS
jgi:hypothetical protein